MTEGSTTRMKRNGARLFKNPPQPHMCIQDSIRGSTAPCYVNVLSWEKIAMPCKPSQPVPLYGGMRVRPPRTKAEAVVFAVITNPEVLKTSGKNAEDPKKRTTLVEVLLDFVEAMNNGIVFTRQYRILKDRDITGELKEVWNVVQARGDDRQQLLPQQETWIDAQPPVPQYPQYQEQQQQQQQLQQQQQQQQQHQHQQPQPQPPPQQQQQDYTQQPPQYHTSVAYNRAISGEGMHFDGGYGRQPPNSIIPPNDQIYQQPGQIIAQQYHGNVPRMPQDRYNYRERGRDNLVPNIPQQNCPAYPAPYKFQPLRRRLVPQYVNSNVHTNSNLSYGAPANANVNPAMNSNIAANFQYITYPQMDNSVYVEMRRMQPQQPQIHLNHVQSVPQYEPTPQYGVQPYAAMRVLRSNRHMGAPQKNNTSKRRVNSPTHSKSPSRSNCQAKDPAENGTKPKSPVKVLQRELPSNERQELNNILPVDNNKSNNEKINTEELPNVQTAELDCNSTNSELTESTESPKQFNETQLVGTDAPIPRQNSTSMNEEIVQEEEKQSEFKDVDIMNGQNSNEQKNSKSKVSVIKFHKVRENAESNKMVRMRMTSDHKTDSPKRQTTVNIIKSVFKMHPGMSGDDTHGKRRTNGQGKSNGKNSSENEEIQQGYTILKKSESATQEEVVNELAQIYIQDCKDAAEVSPVLS